MGWPGGPVGARPGFRSPPHSGIPHRRDDVPVTARLSAWAREPDPGTRARDPAGNSRSAHDHAGDREASRDSTGAAGLRGSGRDGGDPGGPGDRRLHPARSQEADLRPCLSRYPVGCAERAGRAPRRAQSQRPLDDGLIVRYRGARRESHGLHARPAAQPTGEPGLQPRLSPTGEVHPGRHSLVQAGKGPGRGHRADRAVHQRSNPDRDVRGQPATAPACHQPPLHRADASGAVRGQQERPRAPRVMAHPGLPRQRGRVLLDHGQLGERVPFNAGQANAQVAALRALDVAGGRDPGTHYYGMVTDGGTAAQFMRGLASAIPGTPDPSAVASGPTGSSLFPWDTDGSYGDWYGGHELGPTFGRLHPGFCNGNSADDPNYPFPNGQLSNADGAFTGLDVGDDDLGILPAALPGTIWHDVMTYCDDEWLSSYAYVGIRDRLVAEEVLFPDRDDDDDDDDDGAGARTREEGIVNGDPVHVSAVVNLTNRSAQIYQVTPLPGPFPQVSAPLDERFALRIRMPDGSTRLEPVVFKPDVCQDAGSDETGLVDTVVAVDPAAIGLELLLDGDPIASFEPGDSPGVAENLRVDRGGVTAAGAGDGLPTGAVLSWGDSRATVAGAGPGAPRYAVQASTDGGGAGGTPGGWGPAQVA